MLCLRNGCIFCNPQHGVQFGRLAEQSTVAWDGIKSTKDVRIVLLDVVSLAVMAEAEAIGKARRHEAWVDRRMSRMPF